jgi:argininosuccinate lyase
MLTIVKGLPISYFKDLQDDKDLVFRSFDNLKNCLIIFDEVINGVIVNKRVMLDAAKIGFTTATDFADALVKNMNFSFREAYLLTAKVVNLAEKKNLALNEVEHEDLKNIVPKISLDVMKNLDLRNSVNSKKSYGGTSFENIKKMIRKHKKEIK